MASTTQREDRRRAIEPESTESILARRRMMRVARCSCKARLFDGRETWVETDAAHAIVAVKCWRCRKIALLAPASSLLDPTG